MSIESGCADKNVLQHLLQREEGRSRKTEKLIESYGNPVVVARLKERALPVLSERILELNHRFELLSNVEFLSDTYKSTDELVQQGLLPKGSLDVQKEKLDTANDEYLGLEISISEREERKKQARAMRLQAIRDQLGSAGDDKKENREEAGQNSDNEAPTTFMTKPTATAVLTRRERVVAVDIVDNLTSAHIRQIFSLNGSHLEGSEEEIKATARMITRHLSGEVKAPNEMDYLDAKETGRDAVISHAQLTLEGLIVSTIAPNGAVKRPTTTAMREVSKEVRHLMFLVGKGSQRMINIALDRMNSVERTLVVSAMGAPLKEQLDYPDLEECGEAQMAEYIERAALRGFGESENPISRMKDHQRDASERIITACYDRMNHSLNLSEVIAKLMQSEDAKEIFFRLIEIAEEKDFLDELECFFLQSDRTRRYARVCRNRMQGAEEGELG